MSISRRGSPRTNLTQSAARDDYADDKLSHEDNARRMAQRASFSKPHGRSLPQKFRHHRPHRPRQVDVERPSARVDRLGDRPRDAGPDPRRHGPRTRARHHHQGPRRAHDVQGPRRQHLSAQPHRYSRPRRLQLRGLPLAGLLRGCAAGGRRQPGRRGADACECLSGHQPRSGNHSRHQQNRPALGRHRAHPGGHRKGRWVRRDGRYSRERQDRPGRRRCARSDCSPPAAAHRRPRCPAAGPDLRLLVRRLPRRYRAGARHAGHAAQGPAHPLHVQWQNLRSRVDGRLDAQTGRDCRAARRRGGLLCRHHQDRQRHQNRRHRHRRHAARCGPVARL